MATINFTKTTITKLPTPAVGREHYSDARYPGLMLTVYSTGRRAWKLYRRVGGVPTRLALGEWPSCTVEIARKAATRMAGAIATGVNPAKDKREARQKAIEQVRKGMLFGELFEAYLGFAKGRKKSWQADEDQRRRYLADWQGREVSSITRQEVAARHAKIGATAPYAANRTAAMLSAVFNFGIDTLGRTEVNPASRIKRFAEQSRERVLRHDELQSFFVALNHDDTPELWRDFFTLALMTGARRANVMAMKWADLELQRGLWRIGGDESKNKEPLVCILHPAAVEILCRRAAENSARGPEGQSHYVFPGDGKLGHVTDPTKPWRNLLERASITNLRVHDLRRTFGSWQVDTGASLPIIGASLGHKDLSTTRIYARLSQGPVRASVRTAVDAMLLVADGKPMPELLEAGVK